MEVISARTNHTAFHRGLTYLQQDGYSRDSRNGPVIQAPTPVATVFEEPQASLQFFPERNTNIAFLVYEALWMLAGRDDLKGITKYVRRMADFSDNGQTFHGAYGYRWRHFFDKDQLPIIADRLKKNYDDRRSVLTMWDPVIDLREHDLNKDLPCNMIVTFQISTEVHPKLNMVVFCRSNDIIMGTYFANVFHFGLLLEYMAGMINVKIGTYTQVSVNFHAYKNDLDRVLPITERPADDPYFKGVNYTDDFIEAVADNFHEVDRQIQDLLLRADEDRLHIADCDMMPRWYQFAHMVLYAYQLHREKRTEEALDLFNKKELKHHWLAAMEAWLRRRLPQPSSI